MQLKNYARIKKTVGMIKHLVQGSEKYGLYVTRRQKQVFTLNGIWQIKMKIAACYHAKKVKLIFEVLNEEKKRS